MYSLGDLERASKSYNDAIVLSRKHKFMHEEAVASELTGHFYYERNNHHEALGYFAHSVRCYEEWGAKAVASRVEKFVRNSFASSDLLRWPAQYTISLDFSSVVQEKKRIDR